MGLGEGESSRQGESTGQIPGPYPGAGSASISRPVGPGAGLKMPRDAGFPNTSFRSRILIKCNIRRTQQLADTESCWLGWRVQGWLESLCSLLWSPLPPSLDIPHPLALLLPEVVRLPCPPQEPWSSCCLRPFHLQYCCLGPAQASGQMQARKAENWLPVPAKTWYGRSRTRAPARAEETRIHEGSQGLPSLCSENNVY